MRDLTYCPIASALKQSQRSDGTFFQCLLPRSRRRISACLCVQHATWIHHACGATADKQALAPGLGRHVHSPPNAGASSYASFPEGSTIRPTSRGNVNTRNMHIADGPRSLIDGVIPSALGMEITRRSRLTPYASSRELTCCFHLKRWRSAMRCGLRRGLVGSPKACMTFSMDRVVPSTVSSDGAPSSACSHASRRG